MSNVLVGSGNAGQFVHDNQTMGTKDGFRNVSKLWLDKTITIDEGLEKIESARRSRVDIVEKLGGISIALVGAVVNVVINGMSYVPTAHAMLQMGTWLDVPHTLIKHYSKPKLKQNGKERYARDARDMGLIVDAFNLGLSRLDHAKQMLWRTYNDGTLRALLSDKYAIVDNRWYLEILKDILPAGRLSHWRGDADTLYGNVLIPDTLRYDTDSDYGGMLSLSNCEIGKRKLSQFPSIFRAICMNGCIWDRECGESLVKYHKGKIDLTDLRSKIFTNLNSQIPLMDEHVKRFLSMRDRKLETSVSNLVAQVAIDEGLSAGQAMQVIRDFNQYEAGDRNAFGLINALTRAGQTFDNESWVAMDAYAGNLVGMNANAWSSFNARAATIDAKKVQAIFGMAG